MMEQVEPHMTLDELIEAARTEQWEVVDENIATLAKNPEVTEWALSVGFRNKDDNLRDLGVSIIEKTDLHLKPEDIEQLRKLAFEDQNQHVQYRSAFALFTQGQRTSDVISKIEEARSDPDVRDIADNYLAQDKP